MKNSVIVTLLLNVFFHSNAHILSNRMFELYSNQEGQNLTKIIRASKLHSALPKILTLPISRKKKSYMQAKKPITCNKGNCYSPVYLHLVQPTASVKLL